MTLRNIFGVRRYHDYMEPTQNNVCVFVENALRASRNWACKNGLASHNADIHGAPRCDYADTAGELQFALIDLLYKQQKRISALEKLLTNIT